MDIINEIKQTFKQGSITTRLIYVNLAVFLFVRILAVVFFLFKHEFNLFQWLALPSDLSVLATRPWTLVTYMFLHYDFIHILFNLLWLYWFSKIFLHYFDEKKLLSFYFLGGIVGGLLYVIAYNIFPVFDDFVHHGVLLGASASIIAIVVATAVFAPNLQINLLLISSIFGPIKIVWIAVFSVVIYFLGITGKNPGGNIAHLGGALWGLLYMLQLKKGNDFLKRFNNFLYNIDQFLKPRKRLKVTHRKATRQMSDWEYNNRKKQEQEDVNAILDKIGRSGYDSLSKTEKELLFKWGGKKGKPN
jgi:membrane associated rhomboid family serine protease